MVLSSTRRISNNKENSTTKSSVFTKSQRKLPRKTCLKVPGSREAARLVPEPSVLDLFAGGDATEHKPVGTVSCDAVARRKIALPRQLRRPAFRSISSAAIAAIDPELSGIPIEYIYQKLQSVGEQMHSAITKITARCPKGRLPHELEVIINDSSSDIPTHVFAVYSEPSTFRKQRVTLHPAHALVLATQCAHLPPLSHSQHTVNTNTVTLPVIPLRLPSPQTFTLLLAYLYTHRTSSLLSALLPISSTNSEPPELSGELAEQCTISTLLTHVYATHGFWSNVVALGVFDDTLWRILDHAWAALLGAIAARTGERWCHQEDLP